MEYTYDNALRVMSQTNKLANETVINQYEYTYDKLGNQTIKKEFLGDAEKITEYGYDKTGRLTTVTEPDSTVTTYVFDGRNNIMTKNIVHPGDFEYTFTQNETDYMKIYKKGVN